MQIVTEPIVVGCFWISSHYKFVHCLTVAADGIDIFNWTMHGSPLAININTICSTFYLSVVVPVVGFHALAFIFVFNICFTFIMVKTIVVANTRNIVTFRAHIYCVDNLQNTYNQSHFKFMHTYICNIVGLEKKY